VSMVKNVCLNVFVSVSYRNFIAYTYQKEYVCEHGKECVSECVCECVLQEFHSIHLSERVCV